MLHLYVVGDKASEDRLGCNAEEPGVFPVVCVPPSVMQAPLASG